MSDKKGSAEFLPEPIARRAPSAEHAGKILVVDDKAANRQLLWAILTPEGYDVVEAADGLE